ERLLARDKGVAAPAMDEGTAIEAVLGAEQCQQVVAVPLLDHALDDDVKGIRRLVLLDNRFVRPEVVDVERRTQRLDLCWRQTIKRRICSIESLGHCTLKSRGLELCADRLFRSESQCAVAAVAPMPVWLRTNCASKPRRSAMARVLRSRMENSHMPEKARGIENIAGLS